MLNNSNNTIKQIKFCIFESFKKYYHKKIIELDAMVYDVIDNTKFKDKLIVDTINISEQYKKKFNMPCPYKYDIIEIRSSLEDYINLSTPKKIINYYNERNTQHFVWCAKMLYQHYKLTNNKKYNNLSKEIIDFVCKNHCFKETKILMNWFGNRKTNGLVSLKSLTCSEMFILYDKLDYFENTFNYLCKYAYNNNTKLFASYVFISNNNSLKHEQSYLHENLELAEGLFNVYELDKNKYKQYYNYACNIVKETFKLIPNNVNNLAPLQCYYWGLKYKLLDNTELKILKLHIEKYIISKYEKYNSIGAYNNKNGNNIFPYIYLQRIYNLLSNDKPILFTQFLQNRGTNYNKQIEYYEDKINTPSILEKLNIPLPKRYFILDNVDDIRNVRLPNNCVIKYNNLASSKGIVFRKNGKFTNNFNLIQVIDYLKKNNKQSKKSQISIKNIKQKIIIEELLFPSDNNILYDIKCFIFNGIINHIIIVNNNNRQEKYTIDTKYNRLNYDNRDQNNIKKSLPKIKYLNDIINYSNKIAQELFPDTFVRLDFYSTTRGGIFGEFTLKPGVSGITKKTDELLGQLL